MKIKDKAVVETFDVLGVKIASTNPDLAMRQLESWIESKERKYVCVAPVSTVVDCQFSQEYLDTINQAGMVTPDGMPLVWLAKLRGDKKVQRTYGPHLLLKLCEEGQKKGYRHYFYGGTNESLSKLILKLKDYFPDIAIVGHYSPLFRQLKELEDDLILDQINSLRPDIIWVGLGSPKQDFWMAQHRHKLHSPLIIGVGAAFDFISGTKRQAPVWMQKNGLEWFFRLCCEPQRLWRRYLVGNTLFVYFLIKECFRKRILKTH